MGGEKNIPTNLNTTLDVIEINKVDIREHNKTVYSEISFTIILSFKQRLQFARFTFNFCAAALLFLAAFINILTLEIHT